MHTVIGKHGMIGDTRVRAFVDEDGVLRRIGWSASKPVAHSVGEATWPDGISTIRTDGVRRLAQSYRAGTTILDTYFSGPEGAIKLTDFMPVTAASVDLSGAAEGAGAAPARVVRFLTCTRGSVRGALTLALAGTGPFRQGSTPATWSLTQGPVVLYVEGGQNLHRDGAELVMPFALKAGEQAHMTVTCTGADPALPATSLSAARKALAQCDAYWRSAEDGV